MLEEAFIAPGQWSVFRKLCLNWGLTPWRTSWCLGHLGAQMRELNKLSWTAPITSALKIDRGEVLWAVYDTSHTFRCQAGVGGDLDDTLHTFRCQAGWHFSTHIQVSSWTEGRSGWHFTHIQMSASWLTSPYKTIIQRAVTFHFNT